MEKNLPVILSVMLIVFISGCTEQQPITEIQIPGHGSQIYTFSNDIREALRVKTNDPEGVKAIAATENNYILVYNGTDLQDVSYFRIVAINLGKIPIYYSYEGRLMTFDYYYFVDDQWYNASSEAVERPVFAAPVIWLSGPSSSNETSLNLVNNTIYLSGTNYKGLTLAGDKLVLLFFGIDRVPNS